MKLIKSITLILLTFLSSSIGAQTIQFSAINNLDMMIANIFGVQCDGVSNVQLVAVPQQVGRFENGSSIGLTSGLVLSTGIVSGSQQPSVVFNNTAFGGQGDADIANFGIQAGQVPTNYDACIVEFDFSPTLSDTISFTYVLASEEYPEYANSSFTDRFLFLVAANGGAYANIAFLPGTTIPVEINSVNATVNQQYYVDNMSGPNASSFVFDAYTTPFVAQFYAQTGVSYHIKLVIADVSDGAFDSAIFLDEQESFNDINGALTVNNSPAEGILEVFNFVNDTLLAQPVQTITVTNGTYLADSLQTGMYHVRFTPDPVLYPGVAPLYFTNGATWATATAIGLPCFLSNGNINSNTLSAASGSGVIMGNIVIDTTYLKSISVPLENALVKLLDQSNQVIAFTYSDANGNYQFTAVPTGFYSIKLDVPYIPQVNEHAISLIGNDIIIGADFSILTDGIVAIDNLELGVGMETDFNVDMFPNPANEKVVVTNGSSFPLSYELITVSGIVIQSGMIGVGKTSLDIQHLSEGIYFVKFGEKELRKLIVKK
uniref:choice-of-anchor L domain-containing protein n=1 Tax=Fluviicola sp. TaxID=1917219 RepID=UPI004049C8F4